MVMSIAVRSAKAAVRSMPSQLTGNRGWNGSAKIGTIYKLNERDGDRVGNCWAKGRLLEGDYLLCIDKSGDCFYDYLLLEVTNYANRDGSQLKAVMQKLGAYQIGVEMAHLDEDEFQQLLAGEKVDLGFKI